MNVCIGFSLKKSTLENVAEISEQINAASVNRSENDVLIAFCNSGIDYTDFYTELRKRFSEIPVIGGGAIGLITSNQFEYTNPVAGAMLVQGNDFYVRYGSVGNFVNNEIETGEKLIREIGVEEDDKALMLFFESAAVEGRAGRPPELNHSTFLCDGIYKELPESTLLVGGGLVGDLCFKKTFQFCGDRICRESALGLMFGGKVKAFSQVFHGCAPLDGILHTITKVTDGVIEEIDGECIVDVIDNLFKDKNWRSETPLKLLTLGINKGEKFCEFVETNFVNRLIVGLSPDGNGIVPFEPSFHVGDEILFMLRDNNRMVETAGLHAKNLVDKILFENKKPYFAFYINCAGRAADNCDCLNEEVIEVQNVLKKHNIPLFGFYSGVEIAPYNNRSFGLNWTGVLFVLTGE